MKLNLIEKLKEMVKRKSATSQLPAETAEEKEKRLKEEKAKYYLEKIIPQLRKIWQNERLKELTGIENFAEKGVKLEKKLSYDELLECYALANNMQMHYRVMVEMAYECVEMYILKHEEIFNDYKSFMRNNNVDAINFRYKGDMYLIDAFTNLYERANKKEIVDDLLAKVRELCDYSDEKLIHEINKCFLWMQELEPLLAQGFAMATTGVLSLLYLQEQVDEKTKELFEN